MEITDVIKSLITEGNLCIWNFSNNFLGQSTSKWMAGHKVNFRVLSPKVPNINQNNGITGCFKKKHVKIEVKWHARHATADLLSKSVRVIRLRRSGRVASCCARIMRRARQIDALVTLPLLVHGELLGVFLTNWNPGSIFLLTKQSSVSGQPQIWIRGTNQINKCYKRFLENKLRV